MNSELSLPTLSWQLKYTPDDGDLLRHFYIPALQCAVRYDRSTGYFSAGALSAASRGVEGLVRNQGRMRLIVGCTLDEPEVQAIARGQSLRETVEASLQRTPLTAEDQDAASALELLAWMVAKGHLDVKVAIPCDHKRRPVRTDAIFHEKAGIIEDKAGNRLAFNGSINETVFGWKHNWDSFHVFTSWGGSSAHVDAEEATFQQLWADKAKSAMVIDIPAALRDELLKFLPEQERLPHQLLHEKQDAYGVEPEPQAQPEVEPVLPERNGDRRGAVWSFLRLAPSLPDGGERIGEATSPITPWPHQVRAFQRMYEPWPPRLLIADEVGLGKTIQTGLLLRQAWMAGRAKRILILAPKAVLRQWQVELREKFNLNWPIYDGQKLCRYPSSALADNAVCPVGCDDWHKEPVVLASSHLMRRRDRAAQLLEKAEPWDVIVLDEAHHARRRGGGLNRTQNSGSVGGDDRPNQLLRLMQRLREKTKGLILLTATPMQVSPVEVWDLLNLLGLPREWHIQAFLTFFEHAAQPSPGDPELATMAVLFRSAEAAYGQVSLDQALAVAPGGSKLKAKKILKALRDKATIPLRQLETPERKAAIRLMLAHTPVKRLISRHTRELLRTYHKAGKLGVNIAQRHVEDRFVEMSQDEREVYTAVEDYISSTYNNASLDRKTAVGFVMTVYRRRLASSFAALVRTLETRHAQVGNASWETDLDRAEEDILDDELSPDAPDAMDAEEAASLAAEALAQEEQGDIDRLLRMARRLPTDTKTTVLLTEIENLRGAGYSQVMIFTQFTDTLDFLRGEVANRFGPQAVICFSGRGGEVRDGSGSWQRISREATKKRFRDGQAEIMLCTEAAAEGLNFQFCGALINYDMPWNPMKVEQRIGRIDRLGQAFELIRIVNLHYEDTVETDVYRVLRERIQLFSTFVGRLQPILARLPGAISSLTLGRRGDQDRDRSGLVSDILSDVNELDSAGFDLDQIAQPDISEPIRPAPLYGFPELAQIIAAPHLLPPGIEAKSIGKDFSYLQPGMPHPIRVTTDPDYFDAHPESTELWSPGCPVFPEVELTNTTIPVDKSDFERMLRQ
ncbi:DEAD/DEAH box helicase [Desulfonatronum thioautotrophicum]|uniref:DEAD/DEAH box helicase n=1 Tax=Desulfonatronum thioautotrophicum TaxID=617001 RepID=UPI0005EB2EC9|nr:SNF2-related protein [Desulfonatronum thioautotrophicum]